MRQKYVYVGKAAAWLLSSVFFAGRHVNIKQDLREAEDRIKQHITSEFKTELQTAKQGLTNDIHGTEERIKNSIKIETVATYLITCVIRNPS